MKTQLMILQPDVITPELFEQARSGVRRKRGESEAVSKLRLERFEEGLCMQVFARENGYRDRVESGGTHHEIYMGDPRRVSPERLRTVLRHPIERVA